MNSFKFTDTFQEMSLLGRGGDKTVPDMRGWGQSAYLVTGRKDEERNHNSYNCICNVS